MPPSLGVNLRVTGHCSQGGRKYMEDVFSVAYQQTEDEKDLEYAFFGIFDGHGGREAAQYAKAHLMDNITSSRNFWSDDDQLVLRAIREGFLWTQQCMWKELPKWKRTNSGLPSTAGTTASVCFIKRGKLFIGHVGDSGIVLGERDPSHPTRWRTKMLTREHKPDCEIELARIREAGGKVVNKAGVPRVVWYRPNNGHRGPVRRSTPIEEVPFLAVARALGDLWSYNAKDDVFVVSPDPDVHVYELNVLKDRCLVLATDGAWNVLSPDMAVQSVSESERNNERHMINAHGGFVWVNPSKRLVDLALKRWDMCNLRADNTSIVTVMLDPPGPPRAQVLKRLYGAAGEGVGPGPEASKQLAAAAAAAAARAEDAAKPNIAIISRFPNSPRNEEQEGKDLITSTAADAKDSQVLPSNIVAPPAAAATADDFGAFASASTTMAIRIVHDSTKSEPLKMVVPPSAGGGVAAPAADKVLRRGPSIPCGIGLLAQPHSSDVKGSVIGRKDDGDKVQINEVTSSAIEGPEDGPPLPLPQKRSLAAAPSTPNLLREIRDLRSNASSLNGLSMKRTRSRGSGVGRGQAAAAAKKVVVEMATCRGGGSGTTPTVVRSRREHQQPLPPMSKGLLKSPGDISPRILRPRNSPVKTPLAVAADGAASKRKRRSAESNPDQAAKLLRSASKRSGGGKGANVAPPTTNSRTLRR